MTADKAIDLYNWFKQNDIAVWIDGGWGVDALLGKQTRDHEDLDIAVARTDNVNLRQLLESNGYIEEKRNDSSDFMYAMKNQAGTVIDIHVFAYNENGEHEYGVEYPRGSLTGEGIISGQTVNCISPEWMFKFKTAYRPKDKDIHDIELLINEFGFSLPNSYQQ